MKRPVQVWFNVMADVIAIVPAFMIIRCIDACDAILIKVTWIFIIDERMLGPISNHHNNSGYQQGKKKYHHCCFPTDNTQKRTSAEERDFATDYPIAKF